MARERLRYETDTTYIYKEVYDEAAQPAAR